MGKSLLSNVEVVINLNFMKKIITLICFTTSFFANGQVPSSCSVPQELADAYQKDIVQLATNYLFQTQNPDTIYVHVPQPVVDEISGGLAAILNATSIPESDSVFNLYCVHNLNGWPYDYAGFLVAVDTNYSWTQAWQNMITITGDAYIDSLTSRYGLHVTNFYNWSFGNYAELGVDSAWNILALMDSIGYATGVISVEPNGLLGEAGWIDYQKTGSDRYYDFYFEFNDCFDGCDNYHQWSFKVDSNCAVYYLGFTDWGVFGISPLPAPVNCNLFTHTPDPEKTSISLFPNPVANELRLDIPFTGKVNIEVYNSTGQKVLEKIQVNAIEKHLSLDVSMLNGGLYFIQLSGGGRILQTRFVKQ